MERHITEGCEACAHLLALMQRVHQECLTDPVVPEDVVKAAKAVFPNRRTAPSTGWLELPRLSAKLIFDSMAGMAQEGARSAPQATVQAVYHAGSYAIELQIEREPESTEMALVGQVVNRAGSGAAQRGVAVMLMARSKPVAQAESNHFGEFCMVARVQQGMKLCVQIAEIGRRVEIPLTRILAGRR